MTQDHERSTAAESGAMPGGAARTQLAKPERVALARIYGKRIGAPELSPEEPTLLKDVLALIAKDVEEEVRKTLSEVLAANPAVPRDIALKLAEDTALVAAPLLKRPPTSSRRPTWWKLSKSNAAKRKCAPSPSAARCRKPLPSPLPPTAMWIRPWS